IQSYSDSVEQSKKTHGLEDVEDVDVRGTPSPRQDHVWTYRTPKQGDNPSLSKSYQLLHKMLGNGNPEEDPTPTESKAEQRPNMKQLFFSNLLVNNIPPAASSTLEDTAEDRSSLGGHLPAVPQTTETHWKQQEEGSGFLNEPGSSNSPDSTPVRGDLFETKVYHHLRLLIPDKALRMFIANVVQTLRRDCNLPELLPACTKLLSKTGLLIKLLRKRQDDQGTSALAGHCSLERNISKGTAQAREAKNERGGKWKPEYGSGDRVLLVIFISIIVMINFMMFFLLKVSQQ
ncbi:L37A1 protein, partial [Crotophaga sulcirostris]|nr:L37A1 protein [Crotophaga sulcirostris]